MNWTLLFAVLAALAVVSVVVEWRTRRAEPATYAFTAAALAVACVTFL